MRELAGLKITFVAGTLGRGGAERQLFYMLQALRQSGAHPELLCLTRGEFWETNIRALGVPVTWVGQHAGIPQRLATIIAMLRKRLPDIVQSQHFYTNPYAALAARTAGVREIGAMRNDCLSEVRANGHLLGWLCLRVPRMIAANSRQGIDNAHALGVPARRLTFLPNVVDTDLFIPSSRSKSKQIQLLAVGRLVEAKRIDRLLHVVALLRSRTATPFHLTIIGEGSLREQLERQALEQGLSDIVTFAGAQAEMVTWYQQADILILTSDWEGTPNVLLEAMACALPVVATRVGGVPEVVQHGITGYLAAPQEEAMLVERLATLIDDALLRQTLGAEARSYVEEHHALSRLPTFLSTLYSQVTA